MVKNSAGLLTRLQIAYRALQHLPKPRHSFLSPSRGTAPIAQIATWHNVIGLKGAQGIISMLWNKSVTEVLFWEGYWARDAVGLSSGIRGFFNCWGEWERERDRGRWGRGKSLNVCVLFFSPPVKDEKRHAVKDAFDFSASFFFPSHCLFFPLFSRDAGRNCILIMFC